MTPEKIAEIRFQLLHHVSISAMTVEEILADLEVAWLERDEARMEMKKMKAHISSMQVMKDEINRIITPKEFFDKVRQVCDKVAKRRGLSKRQADTLLKTVNFSLGVIGNKRDRLRVFTPLAKQPKVHSLHDHSVWRTLPTLKGEKP